jgi:hypothetical protein
MVLGWILMAISTGSIQRLPQVCSMIRFRLGWGRRLSKHRWRLGVNSWSPGGRHWDIASARADTERASTSCSGSGVLRSTTGAMS